MSAQEPRLRPERWWRKALKVTLALVATFLLIASLSSGFLRDVEHWKAWEAAARALAAVISLSIGVTLFKKRRGRLSKEEPVNRTQASPYPQWLDDLWTEAARRITFDSQRTAPKATLPGTDNSTSAEAGTSPQIDKDDYLQPIVVFAELIMNPAKHRVRVAETIDLEGHLMVQRVIVEFDLPPGWEHAKFLYLPVLHPVKGELVDNFHLRDAGDNSLADLTYEETTRLAAAGLRLLLAFGHKSVVAGGDLTAATQSADWPDEDSREKEKGLLTLLAMRGYIETEPMRRTVDEHLKLLDLDELNKERLRRYVLELCGAYPIVAVIDQSSVIGGRVLIKYERTLMPSSLTAAEEPDNIDKGKRQQAARRAKNWRGLARIGLGLRPSQVAIPISLALTASSYHLRLNAPESKYVFEQHLVCRHCDRLVESSWVGARPDTKAPPPTNRCCHVEGEGPSSQWFDDRHYFRVQRRRGQNFVHLYLRGFGSMRPKMDSLRIVARFKEVPPGSRFQATVTALATTALIIVVGYLVSNHRLSPGSDYPAVILALPVVVASWFGIASDRNALVGGSLLARVSLIVSGALSIASIITYLMTASTSAGDQPPPPQVSLLGVTHKTWITLSVLSLVNFVYIYYRFVLKLFHYRDLLRRTQGRGAPLETN